METKIEEILGFNATKSKDSETITRRFYVTADTPETAKTESHERYLRIKAVNAKTAKDKLESYIRNTSPTSGRLPISDISVDEEQDGDGFFSGSVTYNNPDHKGNSDRITGHVPAYGARWSEQYEKGIGTH
jgi:hypothetical protein